MTTRRLAHQTRHSIGADRRDVFETPCLGSEAIYDALIDGKSAEVRYAREAAIALCSACPIQPRCWNDNRDEVWVHVLAGARPWSERKWGRVA